jgi:hypothetical protein
MRSERRGEMTEDGNLLKKTEEFVRKALSKTSRNPVSEETVRSVALKVVKVIPIDQKEGETE